MNRFSPSEFFDRGKLWNRKSRNLIHSNRIFDLVSWNAESPDKTIDGVFYGLETKDWVNVIPITSRGTLIMVEQYRHGLNSMSLELPGGICEFEGDDRFLNAAKAELREETGFTSNDWKLIGKVATNPGILNNHSYTFLARH
ncbi:MAG: NUDIX hydrolase, partial [Leptospiraceae bacterium]|nr:NUDIX hydrolase [Leptospiraceae bacterium]